MREDGKKKEMTNKACSIIINVKSGKYNIWRVTVNETI